MWHFYNIWTFFGQNLVKTHMWAVHTHSSQWVYIHRRAHCKQAKQERLVPLSCGDRATLWCCFSFARISWKRTSEFLSRVEAYLCYSLRNTLHVCYFHLVKIFFCDIKKNFENIWFWKCETKYIWYWKFIFLDFWRRKYTFEMALFGNKKSSA